MSTIITSIDSGSPAMRAGLRPGQQLLSINGHTVVDVLDYRFYGYDPVSHLTLKNEDGSTQSLTIHKDEGEDLGLNFDTYLMDEMRSCANHCIFCFVDQMPPGMRETLYFKDDDARLSFLQGNYITLTNLTEREAQRIIDLRISPINVSVHTTDPKLHCTMLGNKNAERSLDYIRAFCKAGIVMNGQIVICPGWNDGDQLRRTLRDLTEMQFSSCSLVPVGITKYRQGLAKLKLVDARCAGTEPWLQGGVNADAVTILPYGGAESCRVAEDKLVIAVLRTRGAGVASVQNLMAGDRQVFQAAGEQMARFGAACMVETGFSLDIKDLRRRLKDAFLILACCDGDNAYPAFDEYGRGALVADGELQYAEDLSAAIDAAVADMKKIIQVL